VSDNVDASWPYKPIGDLLEAIIDYRGKTPPKSPFGIAVLTAANIRNGNVDLSSVSYVTQETYNRWMTRGFPQPGDVLITTEAPVGEVASLPGDQTYLVSRRLMALRGRLGELDNDFLKYSLLHPDNRNRLLQSIRGSTVPRVLKTDITGLQIPVPPLSVQHRIADILGALDDKIEINRRINCTLEAIVQALYKHWFVDFGPFQDGEFVESKLGMIPRGWKVRSLTDVCRLTMGLSPKSEFYNESGEGLPFHQGVTYFGERFPVHQRYCTVTRRVAEAGDILFSVRAPVGRINVSDRRIVIGRGLAAIRHHEDCQSFLLYQLKNVFKQEDRMGSGTIFNAVSKVELGKLPLIVPPQGTVELFERYARGYDSLIAVNQAETHSLAVTRDYLLPKLLSGEIRIELAEESIANAV
jgi:type I restriction enzyme S subunit